MSKYKIVAGGRVQAHKGLFGYSQFEQFINSLGAIALELVQYEAQSILREYMLWY
jgi:hypothetical protein